MCERAEGVALYNEHETGVGAQQTGAPNRPGRHVRDRGGVASLLLRPKLVGGDVSLVLEC